MTYVQFPNAPLEILIVIVVIGFALVQQVVWFLLHGRVDHDILVGHDFHACWLKGKSAHAQKHGQKHRTVNFPTPFPANRCTEIQGWISMYLSQSETYLLVFRLLSSAFDSENVSSFCFC